MICVVHYITPDGNEYCFEWNDPDGAYGELNDLISAFGGNGYVETVYH